MPLGTGDPTPPKGMNEIIRIEMWANAQRDGRPAEYRWRPLFNAAVWLTVAKRFALCYQTVVCPVCDVGVLWPNGWMDQDATWYGGSNSPQRDSVPQFSAHVCCGQRAGWIKMALGTEVGLRPGDTALDGIQLPLKKNTAPPLFDQCLLCP